jgi:hypothetical protein
MTVTTVMNLQTLLQSAKPGRRKRYSHFDKPESFHIQALSPSKTFWLHMYFSARLHSPLGVRPAILTRPTNTTRKKQVLGLGLSSLGFNWEPD